jgi:hypothetical protein
MKGSRQEIVRFGVYLLFPVATLFLFNNPEILSFFPTTLDKVQTDINNEKQGLYRIPIKQSEIQEYLQQFKDSKRQ